jgi:hypothetical protein
MHPLDNLQYRDGRREGEREGEIQCKVNRLLSATENRVLSGFPRDHFRLLLEVIVRKYYICSI